MTVDSSRTEPGRGVIVDAIARQDPDAAREPITSHLTRVRDLRVASMPPT